MVVRMPTGQAGAGQNLALTNQGQGPGKAPNQPQLPPASAQLPQPVTPGTSFSSPGSVPPLANASVMRHILASSGQAVQPAPLLESERLSERPSLNILGRLGAGAFGSVWLARLFKPGETPRLVAVKYSKIGAETQGSSGSDEEKGQAEALLRFRDEVRFAAALRHITGIAVHGCVNINGHPTIIMDYVSGLDLKEILAKESIPLRVSLEIIAKAAQTLYRAYHEPLDETTDDPVHFVHRDIKPANIMVDKNGNVRVMDFGTVKGDLQGREVEQSVMFCGTPTYMAPERLRGQPDVHAGDIFSLGIVLLALIGVKQPAHADANAALRAQYEIVDPAKFDFWLQTNLDNAAGLLAQQNVDTNARDRIIALLKGMLAFKPEHRFSGDAVEDECQAIVEASLYQDQKLKAFARQIITPNADEKLRKAFENAPTEVPQGPIPRDLTLSTSNGLFSELTTHDLPGISSPNAITEQQNPAPAPTFSPTPFFGTGATPHTSNPPAQPCAANPGLHVKPAADNDVSAFVFQAPTPAPMTSDSQSGSGHQQQPLPEEAPPTPEPIQPMVAGAMTMTQPKQQNLLRAAAVILGAATFVAGMVLAGGSIGFKMISGAMGFPMFNSALEQANVPPDPIPEPPALDLQDSAPKPAFETAASLGLVPCENCPVEEIVVTLSTGQHFAVDKADYQKMALPVGEHVISVKVLDQDVSKTLPVTVNIRQGSMGAISIDRDAAGNFFAEALINNPETSPAPAETASPPFPADQQPQTTSQAEIQATQPKEMPVETAVAAPAPAKPTVPYQVRVPVGQEIVSLVVDGRVMTNGKFSVAAGTHTVVIKIKKGSANAVEGRHSLVVPTIEGDQMQTISARINDITGMIEWTD